MRRPPLVAFSTTLPARREKIANLESGEKAPSNGQTLALAMSFSMLRRNRIHNAVCASGNAVLRRTGSLMRRRQSIALLTNIFRTQIAATRKLD